VKHRDEAFECMRKQQKINTYRQKQNNRLNNKQNNSTFIEKRLKLNCFQNNGCVGALVHPTCTQASDNDLPDGGFESLSSEEKKRERKCQSTKQRMTRLHIL